MRLWLRVRRARTCLAAVGAVVLAVILLGGVGLPFPNLIGGPDLTVPLSLLAPLAVAVAVAYGLTTGEPRLEGVASRPLPLLDTVFACSVALATLAMCASIWLAGGPDLALAAGRNGLGYLGLTLIGRRLLGPYAAPLLSAMMAVVAALFGASQDLEPQWWAWSIASADDGLSWVLGVVLLVCGLLTSLRGSRVPIADR